MEGAPGHGTIEHNYQSETKPGRPYGRDARDRLGIGSFLDGRGGMGRRNSPDWQILS